MDVDLSLTTELQRPLIKFDAGVTVKEVYFPIRKIHLSNDHTEGTAWLLTRRTIWNLDHKFEFAFMLSDGKEYYFKIRGGYKTDLASTPKFAHVIYPPFDERYGAPALAHDIFYGGEIFERSFNDQFLSVAMKTCGATDFDRFCFYHSVNMFGWIPYRSHTDKTIISNRKHLIVKTSPFLISEIKMQDVT